MANYYQYKSSLGSVPAYTVSGTPSGFLVPPGINNFSGGSVVPTLVEFASVTRWIKIWNTGSKNIRVGFSADGVSSGDAGGNPGNYFIVATGDSTPAFELKITELWILTDEDSAVGGKPIAVAAGLTSLPSDLIINNWSGSVGVG